MYTYRFRPEYGSSKLLLEFIKGVEKKSFLDELLKALEVLNPKVLGTLDLWMNDEVMTTIDSDLGEFTLSIDIWDLGFIMADANQECLKKIDSILNRNPLYIKEDVDFDAYKKK